MTFVVFEFFVVVDVGVVAGQVVVTSETIVGTDVSAKSGCFLNHTEISMVPKFHLLIFFQKEDEGQICWYCPLTCGLICCITIWGGLCI